MNRRKSRMWLAASAALLGTIATGGAVEAQTKKVAYQGLLRGGGGPVTGGCDFEYTIWDAESGGSQVAGPINVGGVAVAAGIFHSKLGVDEAVFDGKKRWMQIRVCCPAGSCTPETLSPRQEITRSPQSLSAIRAIEGAGPAGTVEIDADTGNVGIGVPEPSEKLEVDGNVKASGRSNQATGDYSFAAAVVLDGPRGLTDRGLAASRMIA